MKLLFFIFYLNIKIYNDAVLRILIQFINIYRFFDLESDNAGLSKQIETTKHAAKFCEILIDLELYLFFEFFI